VFVVTFGIKPEVLEEGESRSPKQEGQEEEKRRRKKEWVVRYSQEEYCSLCSQTT
jgi:hypothetical protein